MIGTPAWEGRRYGVFGLARSGRATAASLRAHGAEVWPWDDGAAARDAVDGTVDLYAADLGTLRALVVSPGVPLNRHPLAAQARAAGIAAIGDIELFADARPDLPPARVVGITGTNGKSTCAALLHHIVRGAGVPALLGGNIGAPILGEAPLPGGGAYVLELSSFQIDLTFTLQCDVAVLLNVTPDHLDRYDGIAAYAAAKERLFAMQRGRGAAIVATDDDFTRAVAQRLGARVTEVSATRALDRGVSVTGGYAQVDGSAFDEQRHWPALAGPHNAQNAAAAIAAARALDIPDGAIRAGLASYPGLPHRMEYVGEVRGIRFVNDSKATNVAAAAPALAAFPDIHWIAGGRAKGDDVDQLLPHIGRVHAGYLIGDAAPLFERLLRQGRARITMSGTIAAAVAVAARSARKGDTVLLSPACASFDQFTDYAARGDAFRAAVEALPR